MDRAESKPAEAAAKGDKPLPAYVRLSQVIDRDARVLDLSWDGAMTEAAIREAIDKAGVTPDERQVEEISRELKRLADVWVRHDRENIDTKRFLASIRLQVYWYLTPPALTEDERKLLVEQHKQLKETLAVLPDKLFTDYGAPEALKTELEALAKECAKQVDDYLDSRFLRFVQIPVSPEVFEKQKAEIEANIEKWGAKLKQELADREANLARAPRPGPAEFLLIRQRQSCRAFLRYMYDEPIFCSGRRNIRYLLDAGQRESVYPFGSEDSYTFSSGSSGGVSKGIRFSVTPKEKE